MYTIAPKQMPEEILACIQAGLVPLFTSSPGMGKSAATRKVANDYRLKLIDVRLGQATPEDLNGFPMRNGNKATFTPFDIFPIEGDEVPEGYDGWLLFLDEMTSATKPVQAAAYKLVLDRMVGSHRLHPNVAIVAAGNKTTDKAVVNQMSTAMQSRLIHYELELNKNDWVELAYQIGVDHRIISFISYLPSKLMDFRPDHQEKTFPCPRTWEFLSRLIKGRDVNESIGPRVAGAIGAGTATEFITFAREFERLPKLDNIIASPETTPIPPEISTKYATTSMLIENFEENTLGAILKYVKRFEIEMQILFCRGVVSRKPKIRYSHDEFGVYLKSMVRYVDSN